MAWYHKHKGLAGAAAGFALGSFIPGIGNVIGAIVGSFAGPRLIVDEQEDAPPDPNDEATPPPAKGEPHRNSP